MVCKGCVADCSNTGLVYTMRKLIICFFLRLFMMMKITKIMQH